ncbi:hypothetical protein ACDA63_15220 [Uliginosibacterium sp. sgz301328]|uniref:hypothetical protein n=1 Tax=Uliginosibacterium sp. sgz301328 TaxID=3243764 RepID=UPI00359DA2DB
MATPKVGEAYRLYFIERRSIPWRTLLSLEPYRLGERMDFADERWAPQLIDFSVSEQFGMRMANNRAEVVLNLADSKPRELVIEGTAAVTDKLPRQRVAVSLNGQKIGELSYESRDIRSDVMTIPAAALLDDRHLLVIEFSARKQKPWLPGKQHVPYGIAALTLRASSAPAP